MRFKVTFRPGRRQGERVVEEIRARLKNPLRGPLGGRVAQIMRTGAGSIEEQIQRRTFYDRTGGRRPWVEPAITGNRRPEAVVVREQILWDAALARSAAGSTETTADSVKLIVDDRAIARQAAQVGNQIVSPANYFAFVTGEWNKRTSAALAKPVKPSRRPGVSAMGAFLGLAFGKFLSAQKLASGISTPPKNLGVNPVMVERATRTVAQYIGTGQLTEPSGTAQQGLAGAFGQGFAGAILARGARRAGLIR